MEEVDNIIIHSLKQIGCDIDDEVTNLGCFDTELVVKTVVRCLDVIRPGLGLPTSLPANMAARFRMATTLAQACSDLGYRGDVGYQTFLYESQTDLRKVLMFLIEKLPKEIDKGISEPTGRLALLEKSVAAVIAQNLSSPWLPHYCHKRRREFKGQEDNTSQNFQGDQKCADRSFQYQPNIPDFILSHRFSSPAALLHDSRLKQPFLSNTAESPDWLDSQHNEKSLSNISTPSTDSSQVQSINQKEDDVVDNVVLDFTENQEIVKDSHEQLESKNDKLKIDCQSLKANIERVQIDLKQLSYKQNQAMINEISEEELCANDNKRRIKVKSFQLLENGEENIQKIKEAIEASSNKLISLASQWEKHRGPLIERYREAREKQSLKTSASQKKLDQVRTLKDKAKALTEECRNKDQQYLQLAAQVQKLPKEVNRSAYTQRILEIINNIRKQKDEIDKVLGDTHKIQKDINTLTGKLERSFAVVDELIYRDARTNEASRKAYKFLATLHSDCSELVSLVEETGATVREIRDLEEQIDSETAKNVGANLDRITADLKQMIQETAVLTAQLENKNS